MKADKQSSVGGVAFFSSLLVLPFVIVLNVAFLMPLLTLNSVPHWLGFFVSGWLGVIFSTKLIRGSWAVFIHELKHSVLSSLAGNRARQMEVKQSSGAFAYEYTKETAAYNAFISLAPYILPIFTCLALGLGSIFLHQIHPLMVCLVGFAAGIDTQMVARDLGPHQSDLYQVRGGYALGLSYVLLMNLAQLSFLAAWIAKGIAGLQALALSWWHFGRSIAEAMVASSS